MPQDLQELVGGMEPKFFPGIHHLDPTLKQATRRVGPRTQTNDEGSSHDEPRLRNGEKEEVKMEYRFPEICLTPCPGAQT